MFNFEFLEKDLGIVSPPHVVYNFSKKSFLYYIALADQISLSDIFRYCAICVLQLFVNQAVTSHILKLTLLL